MKKVSFIDKRDYVLFLPCVYLKILLSYKNFNISHNGFMGNILKKIYNSRFSNSYSVYLEYLRYYKKEFSTYREFLDTHYNLTDIELKYMDSIALRCSKSERLASQNYLLYVKSIRDKLNNYFSGEFFIYED